MCVRKVRVREEESFEFWILEKKTERKASFGSQKLTCRLQYQKIRKVCIRAELYICVSQMLTSVANVVIMLQVYGYLMSRSEKKSSRMYYIVYIWGRNITITNDGVHMILCFPCDNFEVMPTTTELTQFVESIHYQLNINLARMSKNKLVPEWDYFFDKLPKMFSPTTRQIFYNISSIIQIIGFYVTTINVSILTEWSRMR